MRKGLRILISASFAYNTAAGAFAPLYAIFVAHVGGGIPEASYIWAAQTITVGVLIFLFGRIEDRLNLRKMLVLGYFMYFIDFLGYLFVRDIPQLLVVQIFQGVAVAVTTPAFDAFYSRSLDRGKESSEWGVWESGHRIIAAGAAVAGGFIASQLGFISLFAVMAIFSGLAAFIILYLLRKNEYAKLFPKRF